MNRIIKFRAWSSSENRFLTTAEVELQRVKTFLISNLNGELVVMQFTGLLDRNGKEIYEGDIISAPEEDGRIYKIKWNEGEFRWSAISGNGNERVFSDMKNGEVIGNVYESPKLLKY